MANYDLVREQEREDEERRSNAAMNHLLRTAGRRAPEGGGDLDAGLHELEASHASGDAGRIELANNALDELVSRARAIAAGSEPRERVPDFDAGARGHQPLPDPAAAWNQRLRAEARGDYRYS